MAPAGSVMTRSIWPVVPCPSCRAPVINAVTVTGVAVKLDPETSSRGIYALSARAGLPVAYTPKPHLAFGRRLHHRHPDDCLPPDPGRAPASQRPGSRPVLGPHPFDPYDPADVPPDPYTSRLVCRTCQAVGEPGDKRHPVDAGLPGLDSTRAAAAAARDATVLGEREDQP